MKQMAFYGGFKGFGKGKAGAGPSVGWRHVGFHFHHWRVPWLEADWYMEDATELRVVGWFPAACGWLISMNFTVTNQIEGIFDGSPPLQMNFFSDLRLEHGMIWDDLGMTLEMPQGFMKGKGPRVDPSQKAGVEWGWSYHGIWGFDVLADGMHWCWIQTFFGFKQFVWLNGCWDSIPMACLINFKLNWHRPILITRWDLQDPEAYPVLYTD